MIKINAINKQCPIPIVMLKESIVKNGAGTYQISVDNIIAVQNLEKMCKQLNYSFRYKESDKIFECNVEVKSDGILDTTQNSNTIATNDRDSSKTQGGTRKGEIVVLNSNVMGHGKNELGSILIKGFIFALSHYDSVPEKLICYNSAVKLLCDESELKEDFINLEKRGWEILGCGTCIDYYNLKEKINVGSIVNMYSIVEAISEARKVVRP